MQVFKEIIKQRIHFGEYPIGIRLKSEQFYADEFGVPKSYIHKELQALATEGYLECKQKSGYRVIERTVLPDPANIRVALICTNFRSEAEIGFLLNKAPGFSIQLELLPGGDVKTLELTLENMIRRKDFSACLLQLDPYIRWNRGFALALHEHFPLLLSGHPLVPDVFPTICLNQFDTGFMAAKLLAVNGYRRPGYFGYPPEINHGASLKHQGFMAGCEYYELTPDFYYSSQDLEKATAVQFEQMLRTAVNDAVFASTRTFSHLITRQYLDRSRQPGRDGAPAAIGISTPKVLARQDFILDCLMEDYELESEKTLQMLRDLAANRGLNSYHTVYIVPKYLKGTSLPNRGEKPWKNELCPSIFSR